MKKTASLMNNVYWLVIMAVIAAMTSLTGCSNLQSPDVGSGGTGEIGNATILRSSVARETNVLASSDEVSAVVQGNTALAVNILQKQPDTNSVFSPYSVTIAFALLAPGTVGSTYSGIEQALSFPLPQNRLNPTLNKIDAMLAGKTTGALLLNTVPSPQLSTANAIWAQKGLSILPAYLDTLAINYGAGVHLVDFALALETSRQAINSWAAEATHNKITDLIPTGGIDASTRLVLSNAVWFKSNWFSPFATTATSNRSFTNGDTSVSTIPFMSQKLDVPYLHAYGCQAVDIPYAGDNVSLLVIMPEPGTFNAFLTALKPATINTITAGLTTSYVDFALPKFNFKQTSDLRAMLQSLGMVDAFDVSRADLSGIDGMHDLVVGNVFHQAVISVDEQGTEAAAATAIGISATSLPTHPEPTIVTINNPFIFMIRDRQTGLILFLGKVVNL